MKFKYLIFIYLYGFSLLSFAQNKTIAPKPVKRPNPIKAFKVAKYEPKKKPVQVKEDLKTQFKVTEHTLSNGLKVYLSENHLTPKVFGMVAVRAGGKNDPAHATGMAHYLEHMLFKGTKTLGTINYDLEKPYLDSITALYIQLGKTTDEEERAKIQKLINEQSVLASEYAIPNEMDRLLAAIGGDKVNAHTTEDYTAYHNEFPANQIEAWLDIYSHRFQEPVFRLFQSELETVYEEKNRSMDNPAFRLIEEFFKSFYKKHPYGQQSIIGKTEHLKNPPLHEMYNYFYNYYVANNMAIILSGDFDSEEVLKMIEKRFGSWKPGKIPEFPEYKEEPFNGRELIEKRLTPIKIGLVGFRTPPKTSEKSYLNEFVSELLTNQNGTGLLDELSLEGKLVQASAFDYSYNDYGSLIILYVPKVVGQKFDDAEKLVMDAVRKLREGKFSDSLFQAIKVNKIKHSMLNWESNEGRVFEMLECFVTGKTWQEYSKKYDLITKITKQDIVNYVREYLNDNYLSFHSKMGFPKAQKLKKPPFQPVIPKQEQKSEYAKIFERIPAKELTPKFVDFEKEIKQREILPNITLYYTQNPVNSVFDLAFVFGKGKAADPYLEFAAMYLNLAGTNQHSAKDFKRKLDYLGATYQFSVEEHQLVLKVTGMEKYLVPTLKLLSEIINSPAEDEKMVKKIVSDFHVNEKFSRSQPMYKAQALNEYALFGNNSKFLRQLSSKQLSGLKAKQLIDAFSNAKKHQIEVYYTGKIGDMAVAKHIKNNVKLSNPELAAVEYPSFEIKEVKNNEIYFLNDKKAVQGQLFFNIKGSPRKNKDIPYIYAFNSYFGEDMSSLVFQEIREFRSLAYSAYGRYLLGKREGHHNRFLGYIGCQDDKTPDAVAAMLDLIHNMPEKPEREKVILESIKYRALSSYPYFRQKIKKVRAWQAQGFKEDPNKLLLETLPKIKFSDVVTFYKKEIQNKPLIISVVGEKKRISIKDWGEKTGKVVPVKEKQLFVN